MDSHVVNSSTEGEEPEKTSVMKKVKARARKLKDTITGLGHGHGQDPEAEGHHTPEDHDLDEDDDEDVDEPQVHAAPIHDSAPMKRTDAPVQGDVSKVPRVDFGDTRAARDERSDARISDPVRDVLPGQNRTTGHEDLLGGARTEQSGPTTGPVLRHEEPKKLGNVIGEGGPHGPPVAPLPHGNYNTAMDVEPSKTSPSGHSGQTRVKLGKIDAIGDGARVPQSTPVSSLPQSTPVSSLPHGTDKSTTEQGGGHLGQSRVNLDRPTGLEEDLHSPKANPQPSNYKTKVTDPTKSGGEESGVTPILHSFDKMNLDGDDRQHLNSGTTHDQQAPNLATGSDDQMSTEKPSNQSSSYTGKISSATSAIADKAMSATNVVASKLGYGWTEKDHDDSSITGSGKSGSSPRQPQNQVLDESNQLKPAEAPQVRGTIRPDHETAADQKPSDQTGGSYISSATSAIASKLGYGGSDQVRDRGDVTGPNVQSGSAAPDQHGKTITSTVYEKVAGVGTAVMSKFQGSGTGPVSPSTARNTSQAGPDKGGSVKNYFAEKLRPGEDDKALSEVITGTLHKGKPGVKEETENSASSTPKGKVTESEEVKQRLGNTEGNENFVVDKIKESVGSMIGGTKKGGGGDDGAQQGQSGSAASEHRRLLDSGN
ncbi:hypothetical protein M0R45_038038 [Rubus argutus]|uniref:Uncharacterized protein n=1 Tax=Rubus argutus TaxID=59490 RepID=A0AAW1W3U4_RUBAR